MLQSHTCRLLSWNTWNWKAANYPASQCNHVIFAGVELITWLFYHSPGLCWPGRWFQTLWHSLFYCTSWPWMRRTACVQAAKVSQMRATFLHILMMFYTKKNQDLRLHLPAPSGAWFPRWTGWSRFLCVCSWRSSAGRPSPVPPAHRGPPAGRCCGANTHCLQR